MVLAGGATTAIVVTRHKAPKTEPNKVATRVTLPATTTTNPGGTRGLAGLVTSVAGNGKTDGLGVPGPALAGSLGSATRYGVATSGDIFFSDSAYGVRKASAGQLSIAGSFSAGTGPGNGGVAVAPDGSVYVATSSTLRKFAPSANTATLALTASTVGLSTSLGPITTDGSGNVYVADGSRKVTRLNATGGTVAVAGTGTQAAPNTAVGDGGPATASPLGAPTQLVVDSGGNVLIADTSAHRVRRVATNGTITTIAGGGAVDLASGNQLYAPEGTSPTDLKLGSVTGVAVDSKGRVYVADASSNAIFRFGPTGGIQLVIADQKGGSSTAGLPAYATRAITIGPLAIDPSGNLLFFQGAVIHQIAGAGN
jgi:sugar lactone lactonase YvrE